MKKASKLFVAMLVCLIAASTLFTGCTTPAPATQAPPTDKATVAPTEEAKTAEPVATEKTNEPLTLNIFDNAANFQGEQVGWFGVVVKKKFNITLNIIAPQISGDQTYQTRAAAGDLGDICIIDNAQWVDCIPSGLIVDLTDILPKTKYLSQYMKHFEGFNKSFAVTNGKIYGMPDFIADTSPTTFSETQPYSSPEMYWPWYKELGMPDIKDLNGLLDVLDQMYKAHPTTKDGKKTIPITIWKDWDTNYMEAACWIGQWYGYQCDNTMSSVQIGSKGDIIQMSDDKSSYKKALQFLFDAQKRGLMDPDGASQQWQADVNPKYTNGQVILMWYTWSRGFYNSTDKGKLGDGWIVIPIGDLDISQPGDAYYGQSRVWCLGSKAKDPDRTMEFMDWLNSPEGLRYVHSGIEGFVYEKNASGKYQYTELGWNAFTNNVAVPEEFGGGKYQDGISAINTCIMGSFTVDPDTGEFYNPSYWAAEVEKNKNTLTNEWSAKFGAKDPTEYFLKHNMMTVTPQINADLGTDTSDISTIRSQCAQILKDASWKMVYAKDQAEFDSLWTEMKTQLDGLGWADLVAFDTTKAQKKVDLRKSAGN